MFAAAYTDGGRTKALTLAETEVADIAAAVARYDEAEASLDAMADAGIAALRARSGAWRRRPD